MAGSCKRKAVGDPAPSDDDGSIIDNTGMGTSKGSIIDNTGMVDPGKGTSKGSIIDNTGMGEVAGKGGIIENTGMGEVAGKGGIIENTGMGEVAGKGNENTDKGKAKSAHNVKAKSAGVPVWGCEYIVKGGVAGKGGMAAVPVAEYTGKGGLRRGRVVYMAAGNDEIWQEAMEVYHREMADAGKGGMAAGKGDMAAGKGGINENAGKGDMAADKGGKGEVTGKGDMAEGKGGKGDVTLPLKGDGKGNFFLQPAPIVGMTRPRRVAVPGMPGSHLEGIPEAHIWHAEAEEDITDGIQPTHIQPTHIIQIPLNMAQGNTRTHIEVAETMRDSTRFNGPTHKHPYGNWVGGGGGVENTKVYRQRIIRNFVDPFSRHSVFWKWPFVNFQDFQNFRHFRDLS